MTQVSDEQYEKLMDAADKITEGFFDVINSQDSNPGIAVMIAIARTLHQTGHLQNIPKEGLMSHLDGMYDLVDRAYAAALAEETVQ